MPNVLFIILRLFLVLAILVGMVMILLGINHFSGADDEDTGKTRELEEDVKCSPSVVSKHSLFHKFLESRGQEKEGRSDSSTSRR